MNRYVATFRFPRFRYNDLRKSLHIIRSRLVCGQADFTVWSENPKAAGRRFSESPGSAKFAKTVRASLLIRPYGRTPGQENLWTRKPLDRFLAWEYKAAVLGNLETACSLSAPPTNQPRAISFFTDCMQSSPSDVVSYTRWNTAVLSLWTRNLSAPACFG